MRSCGIRKPLRPAAMNLGISIHPLLQLGQRSCVGRTNMEKFEA